MHEADYYYMEAQYCIDSFIGISLADAFFEDTEEAKQKVATNEKAATGALGALKKLFDKLVQLVKDCIDKITTFFQTRFMSADEKKRFVEFKKTVRNDPALKNKRITVEDFRTYEKAFDEAMKAIEQESKKENPSEEAAKEIMNKLGNTIKHASERAALSVAMDTAIDIADKNIVCAKGINQSLKHELVSLDEVRKEFGDARADAFENKIKKLSKKGFLHRWRIKLFHKKEATLEAILTKQMNRILSFTNIDENGELKKGKKYAIEPGSIMRGSVKNRGLYIDTMGGVKNAANGTMVLAGAQAAPKAVKTAAKAAPAVAKGVYKAANVATKPVRKYAKNRADELVHFVGLGKNHKKK